MSIWASSRHKIAKTEQLENLRINNCHLENQFSKSLPKLLVHLSWNLHCSSWTTSGSKWAKNMLIENPRWLPQPPSWKSVLDKLQVELSYNVATGWHVDEKKHNYAHWKSKMAAIAAILKTNFWLLFQNGWAFELKHTVATWWSLDWK